MPTTQPPVIVAIDGEAKVSVSNTPATAVPVNLTNTSVAVTNPNLVGLPEIFAANTAKSLNVRMIPFTGGTGPLVLSLAGAKSQGAWLNLTYDTVSGWINPSSVNAGSVAFWYLK